MLAGSQMVLDKSIYGLIAIPYGSVGSMKKFALRVLENTGVVSLHSLAKLPAAVNLPRTMVRYSSKGHEEPGPLVQPTTGYTTSLKRMRI
jgi:hypothetical protein